MSTTQIAKLNVLFATQRNAVQQELLDQIQRELIPVHTAEAEDIRREFDEIWKRNQALAKTKKNARIAMLAFKTNEILEPIQKSFMEQVHALIETLGGDVKDNTVIFKDGSSAKYPKKGMFINNELFRV